MNTYSFWEMGRNVGTGRIASMNPIEPTAAASELGSFSLGSASLALSAISQFGMYLEVRKLGVLRAAEFEERRHNWLIDITDQWIEEHRDTHGILRDVSAAVVKECEKMWEQVCDNQKVDVPQTLLLRLKRMAEFLDWNYKVAAHANNRIVEATGSDEEWFLDPDLSSETVARLLLDELADVPKRDFWGGLMKCIAGLPLFLVPGIGPVLGGGAIGMGIGDMIYKGRMSEAELQRLLDKLPLLQFCMAADVTDKAVGQVGYLLTKQKFRNPMRLLAAQSENNEVSFFLDRAKPVKTKKMPKLKPVPPPAHLR